MPSVGKDVQKLELSHTAGGSAKWRTVWQGQCQTSTEHVIQSLHAQISIWEMKMHVHTKTYTEMFVRTVNTGFKSPKLETTQMLINRWTEEILIYDEILFNNKKEYTTTWMNVKIIVWYHFENKFAWMYILAKLWKEK